MDKLEWGSEHVLFDDNLTARLADLLLSLRPGQKLESERELAQRLGVSRTALRDRLVQFEALGIVERRTGSGTFVKGFSPDSVSLSLSLGLRNSGVSTESLVSVRVALERQAAREAAATQDLVALAHVAVAAKAMSETNDEALLLKADIDFHRAVFEASKSPSLIFFAEALNGTLARSVSGRQQRIWRLKHDIPKIRELHWEIYRQMAAGSELGAMAAMDAHFDWLEDID